MRASIRRLIASASCCLPMMLAGCAGSAPLDPSAGTAKPILPAAPADFGRPVQVREPRAGQDVRAYAAAERVGRLTANARLRNDAAFYRDVNRRFGAPSTRTGD